MIKQQMRIREECRRDGIAALFRVDAKMMKTLAEALPGSIIDIGYPSICSEEEKRVAKILEELKDSNVETAVYSHAIPSQLDLSGRLIAPFNNASACFWIPASDYFISKTLPNKTSDEVLEYAASLVQTFTKKFQKPIDVALTDTTRPEKGLEQRLANWCRCLSEAGARSLVICDSLGIGNYDTAKRIFESIRNSYYGVLEFHGHNDRGTAIEQTAVALEHGISIINTALFNSSERGTLISPQQLLNAGFSFPYDPNRLFEFESQVRQNIGDPKQAVKLIYGPKTIITGSQHRLRGRFSNPRLLFGVTSDRFIYRLMTSSTAPDEVIRKEMEQLKNQLYQQNKLCYNEDEIKIAKGAL